MKTLQLHALARTVESREQLADFARELSAAIAGGRVEIENERLDYFLEAMSAWLASSDNFYRNTGQEPTTIGPWRRVAESLLAALTYE